MHPYYVLTAAHCVTKMTGGIGRYGRINVGSYYVDEGKDDGVKVTIYPSVPMGLESVILENWCLICVALESSIIIAL